MKSLPELTNQELGDYRAGLIEKQKEVAKKRATVTGARKTKLTKDLEEVERRMMAVEKEVKRRAEMAIQRGELRDSNNPDWDTRPIPPVDVETCDVWRAFVAEGAGVGKPVLNGMVGDQQFTATLDIPNGSTSVAAILAAAAQIGELNKTLTRLTMLAESVVSQVSDPTKLANIVTEFTRALELITKNLEETDRKHRKAEGSKKLDELGGE